MYEEYSLYQIGIKMSEIGIRNRLFYGDNLDVLKRSIEDESIDLIYIDPPFNSNRGYNVLFETIDMSDTTAQRQAFADTWSNVSYMDELFDIIDLNLDLHNFLKMLNQLQISKGVVSYLTTMALRIFYMHKKLKQTGSFYLHCDPTMSHYLKLVCDLIFGKDNFRNEYIWKRTLGHHLAKRASDVMTDSIFFYTKTDQYVFNPQFRSLSEDELKKKFRYIEKETGRRFTHEKLEQSSNVYSKGEVRIIQGKEITTELGWRWSQETFNKRLAGNPYLIYWTSEGRPRYKRYADEYPGQQVGSLWDDIAPLSSNSKERLGYPTQKPESLLERIIKASSKEGDVVADFFCGCGTAVVAAERLNRQWIGVDISHLAVRLIIDRLLDPYEDKPQERNQIKKSIDINGFPKDIATAKEL
ncbi:MAG: DNA methyltransferase, partial [Candidatus Electryoneaceae bacterium]|nr:DNA methyltransferase [Candidatus Electryoneaceae bacterium]